MKKVMPIFVLLILLLSSCSNEQETEGVRNTNDNEQIDEEKSGSEHDIPDEYWNTESCVNYVGGGTCCSVNGRILAEPNSTYTYIYSGNNKPGRVEWKVISGSLILKKGQGTHRAVFYTGQDFTTGVIQAINLSGGLTCSSILEITKLTK